MTKFHHVGFIRAGIFIDAIYDGKPARIGKWTNIQFWTSTQWRNALERVISCQEVQQ